MGLESLPTLGSFSWGTNIHDSSPMNGLGFQRLRFRQSWSPPKRLFFADVGIHAAQTALKPKHWGHPSVGDAKIATSHLTLQLL